MLFTQQVRENDGFSDVKRKQEMQRGGGYDVVVRVTVKRISCKTEILQLRHLKTI